MVRAGHVDRVADRLRDRRTVVAATRRRPEPDPDEAARRGDTPEVLVGQVPGVVCDAANPGVRGDDRPRRQREDVVDRGDGRVRDVDEHMARLHPSDHLAARVGQAALLDAMRRSVVNGSHCAGCCATLLRDTSVR